MPFKTLESKETRAQGKKTVTHNSVFAATSTRFQIAISRSTSGIFLFSLFFQTRNVAGSKLPAAVAFDQRVSKLDDSIKSLSFGRSFDACFPYDDRCRVPIKTRRHVVIFEHIVMNFSSLQFVDFVRTRADFAV